MTSLQVSCHVKIHFIDDRYGSEKFCVKHQKVVSLHDIYYQFQLSCLNSIFTHCFNLHFVVSSSKKSYRAAIQQWIKKLKKTSQRNLYIHGSAIQVVILDSAQGKQELYSPTSTTRCSSGSQCTKMSLDRSNSIR